MQKQFVGDRIVYNLWVSGDGTYIANGYGAHSIIFDGGFMKMRIMMVF